MTLINYHFQQNLHRTEEKMVELPLIRMSGGANNAFEVDCFHSIQSTFGSFDMCSIACTKTTTSSTQLIVSTDFRYLMHASENVHDFCFTQNHSLEPFCWCDHKSCPRAGNFSAGSWRANMTLAFVIRLHKGAHIFKNVWKFYKIVFRVGYPQYTERATAATLNNSTSTF